MISSIAIAACFLAFSSKDAKLNFFSCFCNWAGIVSNIFSTFKFNSSACFLISKNQITSRHNIIPIEVKSGDRYTYSSLKKIKNKYKDYIDDSIIINTKDLKVEDNILYLPIYMTILL